MKATPHWLPIVHDQPCELYGWMDYAERMQRVKHNFVYWLTHTELTLKD